VAAVGSADGRYGIVQDPEKVQVATPSPAIKISAKNVRNMALRNVRNAYCNAIFFEFSAVDGMSAEEIAMFISKST
jgi:hypothetical protein